LSEDSAVAYRTLACVLVLGFAGATPRVASAADAAYHHMHLTAPKAEEAAEWYIKHMECQAVPGRPERAKCGTTWFLFAAGTPNGSSVGTGVNHIGFSFNNLEAKLKSLEAAGIKSEGPVRDVPNLFKLAFISDPWGTRIELVEHPEYLGFHHVHLASTDPAKTLAWYNSIFGGKVTKLKDRLDAVLFGTVWLMAIPSKEPLAPTQKRPIDHIGFSFPDLEAAAAEIKGKGVVFETEPRPLTPPSPSSVKISFVPGPDSVRIEVVEPPK
jgi:catechol 2,3-dioxygenase-like lactoylglutathione lyase family enzyme